MARVLVAAAPVYNGAELWPALGFMQRRGLEFEVISSQKVITEESTGYRSSLERTFDEVPIDNTFDGIVVVSAHPREVSKLQTNRRLLALIKEADSKSKPLAGICNAVTVFHEIARDRTLSVYPLKASREKLLEAGCRLAETTVVVDRNLVTAESEVCVQTWIQAFCDLVLTGTTSLQKTPATWKAYGKNRTLPRRLEEQVYTPEELEEIDRRRGGKGRT